MKDDETPGERADSVGRRRVLRLLGGAAGLGATASAVARAHDDGTDIESSGLPDEFRVDGHKVVTVQYRPDSITRRERLVAPELLKRYGQEAVTGTETVERPDPENDKYPQRGVDTHREPWNTYYAKEDEWRALYAGESHASGAATAGGMQGNVGALWHDPSEDNYDYGIWQYYQDDDGGYYISSPMNLISDETIPKVKNVLGNAGWSTGWIAEYTRYAWNSDAYEFQTQHDSAANYTFGVLGRMHVRMWEFGGYVTIQGHKDDEADPSHSAESYLKCERRVEDIFDDESGWYGYQDYYDLPNCCPKDHNGYATGLFDY